MKYALSVFIMMECLLLQAQDHRFEAGFLCGPSGRHMYGNEIVNEVCQPIVGYSFGGLFQYNMLKVLSLRTELAFERKGTGYTSTVEQGDPSIPVTFNGMFNYDYVTVPVMLRFGFGKRVRYFVNAGTFHSYLWRATQVSWGTQTEKTARDETYFNKRFDFGISTGAGVSVPLSELFSFSFEVRNNYGLYNVSAVPVYNNGSLRTNSLVMLFGFAYHLGKIQAPR